MSMSKRLQPDYTLHISVLVPSDRPYLCRNTYHMAQRYLFSWSHHYERGPYVQHFPP